MSDKYFFACVEYQTYDDRINKWEKYTRSDVFTLDHYPTRKEIVKQIIYQNEYSVLLNILSYNELTKDAYDAY